MQAKAFPIHMLTLTALMTALLCILAPLSIPVGPIPLTLATLVIYLSVYLLGWQWGTVCVLVYILLGAMGVPVFSSFTGGLGALLGPTGGYLAGYIPLALLSGVAVEHSDRPWVHLLGMIAGTAALYILGTAWFCFQNGAAVGAAMSRCVWLFIPGDLLKMAAACFLGPLLRRRLKQAVTR